MAIGSFHIPFYSTSLASTCFAKRPLSSPANHSGTSRTQGQEERGMWWDEDKREKGEGGGGGGGELGRREVSTCSMC